MSVFGDREPVEATERRRLTAAQKAHLLGRQRDRCASCQESLIWAVVEGRPVYGPMIDEHIIPLELGGSNDLSNRELRCVPLRQEKDPRRSQGHRQSRSYSSAPRRSGETEAEDQVPRLPTRSVALEGQVNL
jgi:hypothetical protein